MRTAKIALIVTTLVMGITSVGAQNSASYQPSQRLRTAMESCLKDEISEGAHCIKKCQTGFRLDVQRDKPPQCISIGGRTVSVIPGSADKAVWTPPPKSNAPPVPDS